MNGPHPLNAVIERLRGWPAFVGCTWGTGQESSCENEATWHVYDAELGAFLCEDHARPYRRIRGKVRERSG